MNAYFKFLLLASFFVGLISCQSEKEQSYPPLREVTASLYDSALKPFYHGVASGDPLHDRVIIWTRVTPDDSLPSINVKWQMSEDQNFVTLVASDSLTTSPVHDYAVKVDVTGLQPDKFYYYRFSALGKTSATGRTKTTPATAKDSLKFAVVSCSNWEFGYFNAYRSYCRKRC